MNLKRGHVYRKLRDGSKTREPGWVFELHGVHLGMTKHTYTSLRSSTYWRTTELTTGLMFSVNVDDRTRAQAYKTVQAKFAKHGVEETRAIIEKSGGIVRVTQ